MKQWDINVINMKLFMNTHRNKFMWKQVNILCRVRSPRDGVLKCQLKDKAGRRRACNNRQLPEDQCNID